MKKFILVILFMLIAAVALAKLSVTDMIAIRILQSYEGAAVVPGSTRITIEANTRTTIGGDTRIIK